MRMHKEICFEAQRPDLTKIDGLIAAIPADELKIVYESAKEKLIFQNKMATIRTHSEIYFANEVKRHTRLEVLPSVWIGRFCVDFLIPGIGGELIKGRRKLRGLAVEIDGPIHNIEPKMKKDENRRGVLASLGIGLYSIENSDLNSKPVKAFLNELRELPRLSWRAKQRVMSRVYSWTVIANNALYVGGNDE